MYIELQFIKEIFMKNEENKNTPEPKKGINPEPGEEQQLETNDKPVTIPPGPKKEEGFEKEEVESDDFKELDQDPIDDEEFDEHGTGEDSDFDDALRNTVTTNASTEKNDEVKKEQPESIKGLEGANSDRITNKENNIVNKKGQ